MPTVARRDRRRAARRARSRSITGAASGQGRAASVLFAEHGARSRSSTSTTTAPPRPSRWSRQHGRQRARGARRRLARAPTCDAMVARRPSTYFGRLDVLYNNAAVQMSGRLVDCTEDDWDLTIATNLTAIFWACRAALPHMLGGTAGRSSTPRRCSGSSGPRATPRTARPRPGSSRSPARSRPSTGRRCGPT